MVHSTDTTMLLIAAGSCFFTGLVISQHAPLAAILGVKIISPVVSVLLESLLWLILGAVITLLVIILGQWRPTRLADAETSTKVDSIEGPREVSQEKKEYMSVKPPQLSPLKDEKTQISEERDLTAADLTNSSEQLLLTPFTFHSAHECRSLESLLPLRQPDELSGMVDPLIDYFPPGLTESVAEIFSTSIPALQPQRCDVDDGSSNLTTCQTCHIDNNLRTPHDKEDPRLFQEQPDDFSKLIRSSEALGLPRGTISEQLRLCDTYVFFVPVNELIRFFSAPANAHQLGVFYERLLASVDSLPPSVAADLLRLPVRVQDINQKVIRALCQRLLQFPAKTRNLTSMQLALVAWSLAKAQVPCNGDRVQNACFNSGELMDSIAAESIMKIREFQPLSIANLMWACGKMRYKNPHLLIQLSAQGAAQLQFFNAQNIANTYWSLGALEFDKTSLTPNLGTDEEIVLSAIVASKLSVFNPQALANFVWACGKLQWENPRLVVAAAREATRCVTDFKPQEIANIMWGVAKLGLSEARGILQILAQHAAQYLHTFNSQEVANAYWAVGTLEIRTTALTPAELNVNISCSSASSSAHLLTLSGVSTDTLPDSRLLFHNNVYSGVTTDDLSVENFEKFDTVYFQEEPISGYEGSKPTRLLTTILDKMTQFNAQAVANFLWACGKLQWKCPEVCEAAYPVVKRNIRFFRPQNTANFLWAMAKLKFRKEELINLLIDQALWNLHDFNTQELANLYWALGTLDLHNTSLTPNFRSSREETPRRGVNPRKKFSSGDGGPVVSELLCFKLKDFKPQEVANFLWACARLKWKNTIIIEEAVSVALHLLGRFKPQEVGNLLWSLAKLNYRHVGLLMAMCDDVASRVHEFTAQNIANIYWALGSMSFSQSALTNPHPPDRFVESLVKLIGQFNSQEVLNFLWACAKLRWAERGIVDAAARVVCSRISGFRKSDFPNLHASLRKLERYDVLEMIETHQLSHK